MPGRRRASGIRRADAGATIERDLRNERGPLIAGVDEVGRGPLAGPVVACAVIMPPDARAIRGVDDSKALDGRTSGRKLAERIRERALASASAPRPCARSTASTSIHASMLAMRRALGAPVGRARPRAHRRQARSASLGIAAHGRRRRRRPLLLHRLRVDHRQGHARPADARLGRRAIRTTAGSTTSATRTRRPHCRARASTGSRRTTGAASCASGSSRSTSALRRIRGHARRSAGGDVRGQPGASPTLDPT